MLDPECPQYEICPSCEGEGVFDIGDCEDGVWGTCTECEGYGEILTDD